MKALLDTNIIIHRENIKPTNYGIGLLFYWLDKLNYEKCIHPLVIQELRTFKDSNIQALYNAKLSAYTEIRTIAEQNEKFKTSLAEEKSPNDKVDNQLLFEVYSNRFDLLITEDKALRIKSSSLGIRDKVLSVNEFIAKCTNENPQLISYKMLAVKKELFGSININDPFFDTFKIAYPGFEKWFCKKSNEEAYVCRTNLNDILGFLYLKTESENESYFDITPVFQPKKRLKIGTLKVESSGFRLGERFIKIIFDNAILRKVDEIYITLFEDRPELKILEDLLFYWGFEKYGTKKTNEKNEVVLIKKMHFYDQNISVKANYPNIVFYKRQKYFLPILARYHTSLLPDSKLNTENEIDFLGNKPHRYALQKVYISFTSERSMRSGDLLLFYRMAEEFEHKKYKSVLSTVGIIDSIKYMNNGFNTKEEFFRTCKNRSVFTEDELEKFWNTKKNAILVVNFIFIKSLSKRLTLDYLWENNIVSYPNGPRPFTRISDEQFKKILRDSNTEIDFIEK
ncbi:PIN domain-containing protein [Treponema pectinovorum]|uniref:PIN domain-containing protein n=1 Tax=Treponema pectinovorum TaxID=164 RepID=UPI0011C9C201|nr:PIN domain-containing protein [Treponema pectinovorum]